MSAGFPARRWFANGLERRLLRKVQASIRQSNLELFLPSCSRKTEHRFLAQEDAEMARLILHLDWHPKAAVVLGAHLRCFLRRVHKTPVDLPERGVGFDGLHFGLCHYLLRERARSLGRFHVDEVFVVLYAPA